MLQLRRARPHRSLGQYGESPANATTQALTSRVGITLADLIDLQSVDKATFTVREVGGSALAGKYSGQMQILFFSPDQPLEHGTTYEVVVPQRRHPARRLRGQRARSPLLDRPGPDPP